MQSNFPKIDDLLEDLYQIVDEARGGIFSGKGIDKDEIFNIISDIKYALPRELKEARKIIDNVDKIINDAHLEAEKLVKLAEEEAEILVSRHEVTKLAREREELEREKVNDFVIEMREGAIGYADECLQDVEDILQNSLNQITQISKTMEDKLSDELDKVYKNRQEIRMEDLYGN